MPMFPRLTTLLSGVLASALMASACSVGAQAVPDQAPLPSSLRANYFLFKLASSLRLTDHDTPQCDASADALRHSAGLTVSHGFVLDQGVGDLKTVLDSYVQDSNFTPLAGWAGGAEASQGLSRRFLDPQVQGYRYAVDLYPLGSGSSALCVSVLAQNSD